MRLEDLGQPIRRAGTASLFALTLLLATSAAAQVQVTTLAEDLNGSVGGVAVDALGYVYVADFGEKVWKISPYGELSVLSEDLYGASGNAVDPQGRLLQASFYGGTVHRIHRDGTLHLVAENLAGPVGIAIDGQEAIVCLCRSNSLARIAADGTVSEFAKSPLLNCPNGITRDSQGRFYVVNFSDGRMLEVSPEGEVKLFATIPGGGNGHVALASGQFYVTGFRSNRIYQVGQDGQVSALAGSGAFADQDGPAAESAFAAPNGIAYDPSRMALYVNDWLIPLPQRGRVPEKSSLRKLQLPSLTQRFNSAYGDGGIKVAVAAYESFRAANPGRYTEIEFNILGYRLLQNGQVQDAIQVFTLNTEAYPQSFNVWDSLGEGYKVAGDKEQAIRYYRKSLELNPANTNAVNMLKEMGAEP